MKIEHLVRFAAITGGALIVMVTTASATPIPVTFSTNVGGLGTGFNDTGSLSLSSSSGEAATLLFTPQPSSTVGAPTGVNFGIFKITCPTCTSSLSATFDAFTFDVLITETSPFSATGELKGTSTGGVVHYDGNTMVINWDPLAFGPGTNNALSGDFGTTYFTTSIFTQLVAPNSGGDLGETTVQGAVGVVVPEPAAIALIGAGLLGLGLLRRRPFSGQ